MLKIFSVVDPVQPMFTALRLDKTTWLHLRSLNLEGIYANETQLTDFITRHAETLRKLGFRYCSLLSGSWANIVDLVLSSLLIVQFSVYCVNVRIFLTDNIVNGTC